MTEEAVWIIWSLMWAFFIIVSLYFLGKFLQNLQKKNKALTPQSKMVTLIKCIKCSAYERAWEYGDYMMKRIKCKKCGSKAEISGVYQIRPKTAKQIKNEKMMEKWK